MSVRQLICLTVSSEKLETLLLPMRTLRGAVPRLMRPGWRPLRVLQHGQHVREHALRQDAGAGHAAAPLVRRGRQQGGYRQYTRPTWKVHFRNASQLSTSSTVAQCTWQAALLLACGCQGAFDHRALWFCVPAL